MSQENQQKQGCKCASDKKIKAIEKEMAEIRLELEQICKKMEILRKAVRK